MGLFLITAFVATACAPLPVVTPFTSVSPVRPIVVGPLVPSEGVLIGAHVGVDNGRDQPYLDANRRLDLEKYETVLGRGMDIGHDFYPPHQQAWNVDRSNWQLASGRIPMITWRPGPASPKAGDGAAAAIARGAFDHDIRARAAQAKQIDGLFFSRLFHEMDGVVRFDYDMDGPQGRATFVQLWRRVHRIFEEEGVTNAVWVWSPAGVSHVDELGYYPGDAYVDWLAVDPYGWSPCRRGDYRTITQVIGQIFLDFAAERPTMPVMLGEWGADLGDHRSDFVRSVADLLDQNPQVKAIVHYASDASPPCVWTLQDPASVADFRDLVNAPRFASGG